MYILRIIPGVDVNVKFVLFFFVILLCACLCVAILVGVMNVNSHSPMITEEKDAGSGKKAKRRTFLWSKIVWMSVWYMLVSIVVWPVSGVKTVYAEVKQYLQVRAANLSIDAKEETTEGIDADTEVTTGQRTPVQAPLQLPDKLDQIFSRVLEEIRRRMPEWSEVSDGQAMLEMEHAIHLECQRLADKNHSIDN